MMISLLGKNEIEYCLLKGYPLALQIYGNVHLRDAGDIDVLMSRENISNEIRLADSPNDTCPMEYEALQEIVTFD